MGILNILNRITDEKCLICISFGGTSYNHQFTSYFRYNFSDVIEDKNIPKYFLVISMAFDGNFSFLQNPIKTKNKKISIENKSEIYPNFEHIKVFKNSEYNIKIYTIEKEILGFRKIFFKFIDMLNNNNKFIYFIDSSMDAGSSNKLHITINPQQGHEWILDYFGTSLMVDISSNNPKFQKFKNELILEEELSMDNFKLDYPNQVIMLQIYYVNNASKFKLWYRNPKLVQITFDLNVGEHPDFNIKLTNVDYNYIYEFGFGFSKIQDKLNKLKKLKNFYIEFPEFINVSENKLMTSFLYHQKKWERIYNINDIDTRYKICFMEAKDITIPEKSIKIMKDNSLHDLIMMDDLSKEDKLKVVQDIAQNKCLVLDKPYLTKPELNPSQV